jgi:pimeloyl-ACP methyl ester carboxylesterase
MRLRRLPPALVLVLLGTTIARAETLLHPQGQRAKGTIVFFHGFSAKPAQWLHYGKWLHEAKGFDIIAAPLPGHALLRSDMTPDLSRLPKAGEMRKYLQHNEAVFRLARRRGNPIHVIGLSAGGAQALLMGLRHGHERLPDGRPLISSVTAVNPFLQATPRTIGPLRLRMGLVQQAFDVADKVSFGRVSALADSRAFDLASGLRWLRTEAEDHSFRHIRFGHVVALHRFGQHVLGNARPIVGPRVQLFLSEDPVADPHASLRFARIAGAEVHYSPVKIHNLMKEPSRYDIFRQVTKTLSRPAAARP